MPTARNVENILRPLGLHWRIQGMLDALDGFWNEYRAVPMDYDRLISVPTVGQYIAGAVICFSSNQPITLIDSNIVRVVGRVFGLDLSGEARRKKPVIQAITDIVDPDRPRDFYYALIDLAHTICRPRSPACADCPLLVVPCRYGHTALSIIDMKPKMILDGIYSIEVIEIIEKQRAIGRLTSSQQGRHYHASIWDGQA